MKKRKCIIAVCALMLVFTGCSKNIQKPEESSKSDTTTVTTADVFKGEYTLGDYTAPVFSDKSGFYNKEFMLDMSADGDVYYTLDGSKPNLSSKKYTAPITIYDRTSEPNCYTDRNDISTVEEYQPDSNVTKCTVVRAAVIDSDGKMSEVSSATYFVGIDIAEQYNSFPVVSLIVEPDDLFNYEKGIYVKGKAYDDWVAGGGNEHGNEPWAFPANYNQKGKEWEKVVDFSLFEGNGELALQQKLGLRTMGSATRSYLQKSLRLYARAEYGDNNINYSIIPDNTKELDNTSIIDKYKKILLRNGGNDADYAKLRDFYIQTLVQDRCFDTQEQRPAVAFINGEYWGVYNLAEDYDDDYIEDNYDVPKDDVVMVKVKEIEEGNEEDITLYTDLIDYARNNDLSVQSNYDKICEMMDIRNFIEYYCTQIYIVNMDWMNYNNNYSIWRSRTVSDMPYQDGKWRWMLYGSEFSLGLYENGTTYNTNSLRTAIEGANAPDADHVAVFSNLLKNDKFKEQFVTTFMDMTNVNFKLETAVAKLDEMAAKYRPVMAENYRRFGPDWVMQYFSSNPEKHFDSEIDSIKLFMEKRGEHVPEMLKDELELNGEAVEITIKLSDEKGGYVLLNTTKPEFTSDTWKGRYFTDYPIELTAVPNEGFTFSKWQGAYDSTDETINITFKEAMELEAVFEAK